MKLLEHAVAYCLSRSGISSPDEFLVFMYHVAFQSIIVNTQLEA